MASNAATLKAIRALGLHATITEGEFRVTFKNVSEFRAEAVAYYTDSAEDALGTARIMAASSCHDAPAAVARAKGRSPACE